MNRFIIVDGLPYLFDKGKAFAVRWDEKGFTVGAEVELTEAPSAVFNEISILAKCAGNLDSIQEEAEDPAEEVEADEQAEQTEETEEEAETEAETEEAEDPAEEVEADEADIEEMTLEELKAFAKAKGISLNGARTKAAIIEAINAAE